MIVFGVCLVLGFEHHAWSGLPSCRDEGRGPFPQPSAGLWVDKIGDDAQSIGVPIPCAGHGGVREMRSRSHNQSVSLGGGPSSGLYPTVLLASVDFTP